MCHEQNTMTADDQLFCAFADTTEPMFRVVGCVLDVRGRVLRMSYAAVRAT
jgi:hypothetical protein